MLLYKHQKEVKTVDNDIGQFLGNFLAIASFFITLLDFINKNRDTKKKKKPEKPVVG